MTLKEIHNLFLKCHSVSIDTRKIQSGSFFVAIRGDRFDANTFAQEALDKGASYVIIDNSDFYIDVRTVLVEDSLIALQELAKYHRAYLKLPIIALTGSNGKTTTKELMQVVLQKKYATGATVGNFNNHIGVPLTLLSFDTNTEIGIVEMGANHQKEIEFLCELAQPDYGYISNFGKAHLEGFGGVEGVIKGKSELYDYLRKQGKTVFVNLDDSIQKEKTTDLNRYTFGVNNQEADVNIGSVKADPFVQIQYDFQEIHSKLIGLYNANNINAAIAVGQFLKVDSVQIKAALESYVPENNRSQLVVRNTNEIILDAYNANPSSMAVAIANFIQLDKTNKIAILGDMFELGEESRQEHADLVELASKTLEIDYYFVGADFYENKKDQRNFHFYESFESFSEAIGKQKLNNKMILIKGSRGMALERTLDFI